MSTWTKKEIEDHIKVNVEDYGAAIVCAALFKKLYGVMPEIGLSGFQGEAVDALQTKLPSCLQDDSV